MPAMQLKAFRQKGEKVEVSHFRVNVNRFRARLNIVCITEKLLTDIKCDGWPDVSHISDQYVTFLTCGLGMGQWKIEEKVDRSDKCLKQDEDSCIFKYYF
jgi:hypothetical protein